LPPAFGIESERHGEDADKAHRHHPGGDDRHGKQIGEHAVGRDAMKVVGRIGRGSEAGDERSENKPLVWLTPHSAARAPSEESAPGRAQGKPRL
jgi:hypothetical protein